MLRPHQPWPAYFVLVVALAATFAVSRYVVATGEAKDRDRFENAVQATDDNLRNRMETYVNVLWGAAALLAVREPVTRREFRAFVKRLELRTRYPGIQGVGFSMRLAPGEEEAVIAWMRAQGLADFQVWPQGTREERHAILHLEPLDRRNRAAIGYDMFSEPVRNEAMSRARDTGRAAASGGVTLVQEIDAEKQAGFLIYVPVYGTDLPTATVEDRRAALRGFVYSPFRIGDLLAGIFGTQQRPRVAFEVYDGPSHDPAQLLGRSDRGEEASPPEPARFTASVPMGIAGRVWTVRYRSTPAFEHASQGSLGGLAMLVGVVFSFLLFGATWLQWSAREAAERLAAELRESEQALRDANRSKDEFLAMLGHELRNPLGASSNAVAILRTSRSGEPAFERALDVVERQVRLQNRLLADLLDVSRVSSGRLQLEKRVIDVGELAQGAVEAQRGAAEHERHTLTLTLPAERLMVEGDPARLDQAISNLLSNAIKYTPAGGHVEVELRRDGAHAVVVVHDDGVGMREDLQARIFEPFVQATRSLDRSQGGLGLGLALVRRLVEMHDGEVAAQSPGPNLGSAFTIRLPLVDPVSLPAAAATTAAPVPPVPEQPNGSGRHVLVIEDIDDARATLADLLAGWGCSVTLARSGAQGLRAALDHPPDVAVIDIGLPGMDGYQVARRLRASPAGAAMRLIALTGYGQPHDRRAAFEAGFDFHLVKPLDPDELRRLV